MLRYSFSGFQPNASVSVYVQGGGGVTNTASSSGSGEHSFINTDPPGTYTLVAEDQYGHRATDSFQIAQPTPTPTPTPAPSPTPTPTRTPTSTYPIDKWERLWHVYDNGFKQYLGSGPHENNRDFDNDWGTKIMVHNRSDKIGFISSRTVSIPAGTYEIVIGSDDGIRLWVDNELLIDAWRLSC
ncbi:PA14 domain-containing protein [Chloroflexota bacterium]